MNIAKTVGMKLAGITIGAGLMAGAAFALTPGVVIDVTLPESVNIGNKVIPGGNYQVSEVPMGSESFFVFRDNKGETAAVAPALGDVTPAENQKTEFVLAPREDGSTRLDKLFIEGDGVGFKFVNVK